MRIDINKLIDHGNSRFLLGIACGSFAVFSIENWIYIIGALSCWLGHVGINFRLGKKYKEE